MGLQTSRFAGLLSFVTNPWVVSAGAASNTFIRTSTEPRSKPLISLSDSRSRSSSRCHPREEKGASKLGPPPSRLSASSHN
ncbi:hypothetical protein COLO4_19399 [Corchorus olitorius]|uniref:Secreted protein n=1 Tax=Corchorus olitorius TaxID=93759 RepID=A0A1R3J5H6_9ROSI|nr:hypothetical protein COLO4_19399 [Corchorus olitorius]